MNLEYYSYLCTRKSNYSDSNDTKQAIQHIQGGSGPGVPAGVLHGAWGAARDGARRDAGGGGRAGAVGGLRGAGMLQVHGAQRRGCHSPHPRRHDKNCCRTRGKRSQHEDTQQYDASLSFHICPPLRPPEG